MRVQVAVCIVVYAALLVGCSNVAAAPPATHAPAAVAVSGRVAYIDIATLVRAHPFYAQLAHYDRAIAALRATERLPGLDGRAAEIARDRQALSDALAAASRRMLALSQAKAANYAQRERNALAALLASPALTNGSTPAAARLADTYRQEYSAVQNSASADVVRYRSDLSQEEKRTLGQLDVAMQQRVAQAYAQREAQQREAEATLSLNMSRRDAHQILALRIRLEDLRLLPHDRHIAAAALAAIRQREWAELSALAKRDDATLAAYRSTIANETSADASRTAGEIRNRFAANYDARLDAARTQTSQQPASLPRISTAGSSVGLRDDIASLQADDATALQDGVNETMAAFNDARSAMSARLAALRTTDASASASLRSQIAALQRERQTLRDEIVASILRNANAVARSRGIATVHSTTSKAAGIDLTSAVRSDLASLGTR